MNSWFAEHDGSIHTDYDFEGNYKCVEFVSPIYQNKAGFFRGLHAFTKFMSKNGKYELYKVANFNESCGSHLHFSIKDYMFSKKAAYEIFPLIRKFFLNKLRKSPIECKFDIMKHYNRSYAVLLNKQNFSYRPRHIEFNFTSEQSGTGLEWRSLNLLNVKTWKEFIEFWNIVFDSLEYLYKISQKYQIKKRINFSDNQFNLSNSSENILFKSKKRKKTYSNFNISLDKKEVCYEKCVI